MPSFSSRDMLVKIGNGATPPVFSTIGIARTAQVRLDNRPLDMTPFTNGTVGVFVGDGGTQQMAMTLEGLYRDEVGAQALQQAAQDCARVSLQFYFANGDCYAADFAVESYSRGGSYDGLETFSVSLLRSGTGIFTAAGA